MAVLCKTNSIIPEIVNAPTNEVGVGLISIHAVILPGYRVIGHWRVANHTTIYERKPMARHANIHKKINERSTNKFTTDRNNVLNSSSYFVVINATQKEIKAWKKSHKRKIDAKNPPYWVMAPDPGRTEFTITFRTKDLFDDFSSSFEYYFESPIITSGYGSPNHHEVYQLHDGTYVAFVTVNVDDTLQTR